MKPILFSLVVMPAVVITVCTADLTSDQITKAQQIFTTGCMNCHARHGDTISPAAYTDAKWGKLFTKMLPVSKLKDKDQSLLTEYLAAVRLGRAGLPKKHSPASPEGEKK